MPEDPFVREKFTRAQPFAHKQGIFREISEGPLSDRSRELAQAAVGQYRVHHEAAAEAKGLMADWSRHFDEPVQLPDGGELRTLQEAIAWLAKEVPKSEQSMKQVQAAAHCVTEAALRTTGR